MGMRIEREKYLGEWAGWNAGHLCGALFLASSLRSRAQRSQLGKRAKCAVCTCCRSHTVPVLPE